MKGVLSYRMDKCHGDVSIPACEVDTMEKIKVLI